MIQSVPKERLGVRDKLLLAQKVWRLKAGEVVSYIGDLMVPLNPLDGDSRLDYANERAELRHQANAANLSRYILEKEIGSDNHRNFFEKAYHAEFFEDSINNNN